MTRFLFTTTILLVASFTSAAVINGPNQAPAPSKGGAIKPSTATPTVSNSTDTVTMSNQLNIGIDLDVLALQGELAATNDLITLLKTEKQQNLQLFSAAKSNLRAFFQAGVSIRQNNLALAQNNASIIRTLAQLEQQQVKNIALVNKLTGNPTADLPILSSLQQSLENAIQSSRGLQQQLTTTSPTVPASTPAPPVSGQAGVNGSIKS